MPIITNFRPLVILLEDDAADEEPVAVGLLNQLKQYNFVALLHLAADILAETNHLSKFFQHRDISFDGVGTKVNSLPLYNKRQLYYFKSTIHKD